jgi:general secretion pathway protein G/type IV pilus assembly protein PilA
MSNRQTKIPRQPRGFSLLELLAVLTILAILAVIIVPHVAISRAAAVEKADAQNQADINLAVERWYFEKGSWPADNLSDIGKDKAYFPNGLPKNPASGAAYSLDSSTHRVR